MAYDLMTKTGHGLTEVPYNGITWHDVFLFLTRLRADSSLISETDHDKAYWEGNARTPMLLAQIIDELSYLRYEFAVANTPKGKKKPNPPLLYPRPGIPDNRTTRTYGSEAIPIRDFNDWWDSKNK